MSKDQDLDRARNAKIFVPTHVRREIAAEELLRQQAQRKINRANYLVALRTELYEKITRKTLTEDEMRHNIKTLCGILLNKWRFKDVDPGLTLPEVGQLVSDVLLGPGQGYEIKT